MRRNLQSLLRAPIEPDDALELCREAAVALDEAEEKLKACRMHCEQLLATIKRMHK